MPAAKNKILIIVTNADEYQKVGLRTGLWLGELTHFWDYAEEQGFTMDVASPSGGRIPLDPESLTRQMLDAEGTGKRYLDRAFMDLLKDTMKVSDADIDDYDAIYLTGGHGVMFDFPQSEDLETLIARFYETGRVVATVCHGAAGRCRLQYGRPAVRPVRSRGRAPDHRPESVQRQGSGRGSRQTADRRVNSAHFRSILSGVGRTRVPGRMIGPWPGHEEGAVVEAAKTPR